jgi:hypothetical protein
LGTIGSTFGVAKASNSAPSRLVISRPFNGHDPEIRKSPVSNPSLG